MLYTIPLTYRASRHNLFSNFSRRGIVVGVIMLFVINLYGQTPSVAPKNMKVYALQDLSFGCFCITNNSGGTVVISPHGIRTCNGVACMPSSYGAPAIFNVKLVQGRIVHLVFPASATLFRVGGVGSMTITDFTSDKPGESFITTASHPFMNSISVGATLNVGSMAENPSGNYRGDFLVTFARE